VVNGFAMKMPALLTSVSMRPNRAKPSEIARSAVCGSPISPAPRSTLLPESFEKLEKVLARVRRAAATWAAREQKKTKTGC
jgi:hypothetical protein